MKVADHGLHVSIAKPNFADGSLLSFRDLAAADARSAGANTLGGSSDARMHRAQVDVPTPLCHIVSVADVVSRLRLLAADIAFLCHDCRLFLSKLYAKL